MQLAPLFATATLRHAAIRALCLAGIAAGTVLPAAGTRADPPPPAAPGIATSWTAAALEHATPAELQSAYLECDRMAMTSLLDFGTATYCSTVYEAFKARAFGGDFGRLLAWHRELRASQPAQARPGR